MPSSNASCADDGDDCGLMARSVREESKVQLAAAARSFRLLALRISARQRDDEFGKLARLGLYIEPDATMQPAPQDIQLMSKHCVLGFKPQLRLEWRGQDGQNETEQPDHSASLGDSITASTQIRFSVHTGPMSSFGPWLAVRERHAGR
jgi:hypothetical protein